MIWNVVCIHVRRLAHNRIELLLTFVVPVAFFSIFAIIFAGGVGGSSMPKIKVAIADEVDNSVSRQLVEQLKQDPALRLMRDESAASISRQSATRWVRDGSMTMAIVITNSAVVAGDSISSPDLIAPASTGIPAEPELVVDLLADASDQVASQVVTSVVSRSMGAIRAAAAAAAVEAREAPAGSGDAASDSNGPGRLPLRLSSANDSSPAYHSDTGSRIAAIPNQTGGPPLRLTRPLLSTAAERRPRPNRGSDDISVQSTNQQANQQPNQKQSVAPEAAGSPAVSASPHLASDNASLVRVVDVIGEGKSNPVVSMYAAGIAVMFLLFGATGGGGTLLEERENQTLDRLLSTQMTMDQLLLGKWMYLAALGVVQVTVMFVWAQLMFGVDLLHHLDGFLMMTIVTSSAAAAFGLFLATLCKSRGQLNGLSVILVLTMSALGGSMVPRYVMSEKLRGYGLWTFNAWALDGYDKVFWREMAVDKLAPQLTVLMISGISFLVLARLLAVRWETE